MSDDERDLEVGGPSAALLRRRRVKGLRPGDYVDVLSPIGTKGVGIVVRVVEVEGAARMARVLDVDTGERVRLFRRGVGVGAGETFRDDAGRWLEMPDG